MARPPRASNQALVNRGDLGMIALVSILVAGAAITEFFVARAGGYPLAVAQTAAVNLLALGQLAYLLNCRFVTSSSLRLEVFRGNPWVWRMAGALIVLQLVFTYAPFMHGWFHTAPITIRGWSVAIALSIVIFLIVEVAKWVGGRATERSKSG
jgi:magnesium-transporting ATPase (P-type)